MDTGLQIYRRLFGCERRGRTLDRASLPTPLQFLTERNLISQKPRGKWTSICCPAHKGGAERNPSLRVNLADGHFRCMACGASGGDVLELHRLITGCGFVDAVRDLGGRFHD
ncbi:MAG: hypothetical protein EXR31_06030 [Betaproteobacteria bacterium]|nr:hypothetical protein [Betaproteobacteria bacterium]